MTVKRAPLHEQIRADIESRILSGALAPGDRIPFEHELMETYACARMTVSKALSSLSAAGLIERRKRAGSFVARPKMHAMILEIPDLEVEVTSRGARYEFRLLARATRPPDPNRANEMALAGGGQLLEISGLHLADDAPLAIEDRLISLQSVPAAAAAAATGSAPGAWLLKHVPWTEAENRISAINADRRTAALLQLGLRDACLVVERRTWRGDEHITLVRQIFAAGAYDLVARFGARRNHHAA